MQKQATLASFFWLLDGTNSMFLALQSCIMTRSPSSMQKSSPMDKRLSLAKKRKRKRQRESANRDVGACIMEATRCTSYKKNHSQ